MKRMISLNDDDEMINHPKLRDKNKESDCGMFFLERNYRIDFVLVYQQLQNNDIKQKKRVAFIKSIKDEGLEIEIQDEGGKLYNFENFCNFENDQKRKISDFNNLVFIKVHASWETLCRYAEIMKIRKAIMSAGADYSFISKSIFKGFPNFKFLNLFKLDRNALKPVPQGYTYPFSKQKDYLFDIPTNTSKFFTPVERSLIVNYILKRKGYKTKNSNNSKNSNIWNDKNEIEMKNLKTENDKIETNSPSFSDENSPMDEDDDLKNLDFGIAKLISEGVFDSAYILHEPITKKLLINKSESNGINMRIKLYRYWASFRNIFRIQPLDHIRLYFGEMVAFYFAWLGYYTFWLFPIAMLGVFVTIYNLITSSNDVIINEIYNSTNITMCPVFCIEEKCEFWKLSRGYTQFLLIRLIDNGATVFLAGVTSIWVSLFLEMWNRKQFTLSCRWHVRDIEVEDEPLRPEFAALLEKNYPSKFNRLSGKEEPYISFWQKTVPIKIFTFSTVLFSIVMALAVLSGITITKTIIRNMLRVQTTYVMSNLSTAAIGSLISLITIIILTAIYSRVAVWLTDLEHHRTQSQYDSSVTLKLYVLEFINNYSSMFYIAFIHPYTLVIPTRESFSSIKPQGCLTGDCLLDLSMQMIFILVGKQIINNIVNYSVPRIVSLVKKYKFNRANVKLDNRRKSTYRSSNPEEEEVLDEKKEATKNQIIRQISGVSLHKVQPELIRCYKDNILADPEPRSLFKEYLEMIIQFGFITIFILPFPLGPLLALINNLFEIRNDAMRFVTAFRRPVAQRVKDIGIWNDILAIISKIVVKSNALLIAFATSYIDRLIYAINHDYKLNGFVEFSLSYINSTEAIPNRIPITNDTFCGYIGYRYHPFDKHNEPLTHTPDYWKILAAKIAFVYLFETFVGLFVKIITVIIPDVPDEFRIAMKREAAITNDFILKIELEKQRKQYDPKNMALSLKHTIVKYRNEIKKQNSKSRPSIIMDILKMTSRERKSVEENL